jgi:preprotein translocase subunit SecD
MKSIFSRVMLLGAFTLLALILFLPSLPKSFTSSLPGFWVNNIPKIVLGLDLQGGMHLVMDVDRDKAVENYSHRLMQSVEEMLGEEGAPYISVTPAGFDSFKVSYSGEAAADKIVVLVSDEYSVFSNSSRSDGVLTFSLDPAEVERIKDWAVTQALETIRNRVDKFGVTEPIIQRQGQSELVIQLPGLRDPARALKLIGEQAVLEFRLVDELGDPYEAEQIGAPFGTELMYQRSVDFSSGEVTQVPFLVKSEVLLTGDIISDARVSIDPMMNEPYVSMTFDRTGAKIFARITEKNVNKRLAIILDGNVYSAPKINEKISGGRAQISGNFNYEDATDLAIVLRAGALPAPVTIVQNVTVGPSLGADSIKAGISAIVLGGVLVLCFMILYYRVSGVIANIAVTLNIVMLLGAMAYFNATLTLPGIAGILLTIGMGVDSNVLIFERIKEELRAGRTPMSAVDAGYDSAFWTIIDAHVTTLITAAVLFQFGSGPIKGFAVSLSLGILINLFTALVGTKVAFDIMNDKFRVKKISI